MVVRRFQHTLWSDRRPAAFLAAAVTVLFVGVCGAQSNSFPEMLDDAELTDVYFLDPDNGFAIGDRGVIWRTGDGGRSWKLVDGPASCRLESICFVDGSRGWIAGGWTRPFTHTSQATLLVTEDGGRRWTAGAASTLPMLRHVQFEDARQGIAVGNASPVLGSGVFRTSDGGASWAGVPGAPNTDWKSGSLAPGRGGLLMDETGNVSILTRSEIIGLASPTVPRTAQSSPGRIHAVHLGERGTSWKVGNLGAVFVSHDMGRSWEDVSMPAIEARTRFMNWRCLAVHGDHVWVGGSPGSCLLHSPDQGKHWELLETGLRLPFNALHFLDAQRGWAVGPLGTIAATRDGGKTWRIQRGGGRAAFMVVASSVERIPFELFSRSACGEGFLGVLVLLQHASSQEAFEHRLHQAISSVGGSAAVICDVSAGDASHNEELVRVLSEQIRMWQPDVVIGDESPWISREPGSRLAQYVLAASHRSAATAPADSMSDLPVWKVKKVAISMPGGGGAGVSINPSQFSPRAGRTLAEQSIAARGMFHREYEPPPSHAFQMYVLDLPHEVGRKDLFSGIAIAPGSAGRRTTGQIGQQVDDVVRVNRRQATIRLLLDRVGRDFDPRFLSQLEELTSGLSPAIGGDLLYSLSARSRSNGNLEAAAELFQYFVTRYPEHELAESARLWLFHYHGSGEVAYRANRQRASVADPPGLLGSGKSVGPAATADSPVADRPGAVVPATRLQPYVDQCLQALEASNPALHFEPLVRLPTAARQRRQGQPLEAEKTYRLVAGPNVPALWRQLAESELWLTQRRGQPPKRMTISRVQATRPKLDGDLNDPIWENAAMIPVERSRGEPPDPFLAFAMFAHDREFLFIGVHVDKSKACAYPRPSNGRTRDADLSHADRVQLMLDLDRDYASAYELQIDHLGQTIEACFGDSKWDPKWFVARAEDADQWRIEAAIPWAELTDPTTNENAVWFVAMRRLLPGSDASTSWNWQADGRYLAFNGAN